MDNAYCNVTATGANARRMSRASQLFSNPADIRPRGRWIPLKENGISNYPPEFGNNPEHFLLGLPGDCQQIVKEYNESYNEEKKEWLRQFLLHSVLPHMEEMLKANDIPSPVILSVLPHLSCLRDSQVGRHSLLTTLNVLTTRPYDADEKMNSFIFQLEEVLRKSIVGDNAMFDVEPLEDRGLRVFVYSRALMLVVVLVQQGNNRHELWSGWESLDRLYQKLYRLNKETPFQEKKKPRYAVACIYQSIQVLRSTSKKLFSEFLENWLPNYYQGNVDKKETEQYLKKYIEKVTARKEGWFDLHVVVFCLEAKIHERPKDAAIIFFLVEKYFKARRSKFALNGLKWCEEVQWQTGLYISGALESIVMKNKDEDTRREACGILCLYKEALNGSKNSTENLFVTQSLQRCCFGPLQTIAMMILTKLQSEKEDGHAITVRQCVSFLIHCRYPKQMVPQGQHFIALDVSTGKAFYKSKYRGDPSMAKLLSVSDDDLKGVKGNQDKSYNDLVKEAYFLRRLNMRPHPNILRVYAFDTSCKPYHIITEYADKGNLLKYLQDARSDVNPLPKPSVLLQMLFGIVEGLEVLLELGLVHQAIMSSNVLVAMDRTCKLTGFQHLKEMHFNEQARCHEYVSKEDETSIRHAAPETLTDGQYSEKSVVYSVGNILYEVFTYGNTPFNWAKEAQELQHLILSGEGLPEERCIPASIQEIIRQCHQHNRQDRPSLKALKSRLDAVDSNLESSADEDRAPTEYPHLTQQDTDQSKLSSCCAIDEGEHPRVEGIFGNQTLAPDRAEILTLRGTPQIREKVEKTKEDEMQRLKNLSHANIVKVLAITDYSPRNYALFTENSEKGNLLQLMLSKDCDSIDLVRFLVQILSGLVFLHDSNILHCDIRAENMMVFYDEQGSRVKIARLGRSRYLRTSPIECPMPGDTITRSAPEVIKNNTFSTSSDVWSFALLCFELYITIGGCINPIDCEPFKCKTEDLLAYIEGGNRPGKPKEMPSWMYIAVKQALLKNPDERPPAILLHDCLTYRKPYDSCLLSWWKHNHHDQIEQDKIDLNVVQPSKPEHDHVIPPDQHLPFDVLESMSPVAVFLEHSYSYTPGNERPVEEEELYDDVRIFPNLENMPPRGEEQAVKYDNIDRTSRQPSSSTRAVRPKNHNIYSNTVTPNRRPAPYPRRQPLQPPHDNLYDSIPDIPREKDDAQEGSWHSWQSMNSN